MLNFRGLFEKLFKSFRPGGDTEMVLKLVEDDIRHVMIIKRYWLYGVFMMWWRLFISFLLSVANLWLAYENFGSGTVFYSMAGILFIMTFLWLYSGIKYLAEYRRTYSDGHEVYDVYSLIEKLKLGDIAFTKAFNQTILNIILVLCLSVFVVYKTLSIDGAFASTWAFAIPDILLYGAQIGILANYLKKIIDLEMDFNIVRKGAIFFFNQSMFSGSGTEVAYEKIKTRSFSYDSMGGKMFGYGNIDISTEGDETQNKAMTMQYVHAPSDTIRNIFLVLEGDLSRFEERDNLYLAMIAGLIKINKNPAEMTAFEKAELAHYVKGNEPTIKHDFEKGNPEVKKEIREIYSIIA